MSAALHLTEVGPVERAAHRVGTALLRWSESRAARVEIPAPLTRSSARTRARLAFEQRTALEARHRHWDELAAATPRLR
ncbi:hypothetical protein GCM10017714_26850 [Curtobacterium pusillum]|uniref:Uncharacterized protein n=1 Tax=Curtobacterium pusillum TaxID=69373 RepID=A0ABX2MC71_9MICO|nr:hypothetical protein [Curtobacterium pusillum]NUU15466.1 hypothetical protein [Curtobacterium pusillum]GLK32815.1 hypothetical protein GCM10017610_31000 [Curtobacterium pusillum]